MSDTQKPIRRKIRRKGDPNVPHDDNKLYFSSKTQDAIVRYQNEASVPEKQKIYLKEIMPAFVKLVENLISIHKFNPVQETYDDVKNDCVSFLFETIHKFDATRGTNAFSYFNVVAKNWLIIHFKHITQRNKRMVCVDADAINDENSVLNENSTDETVEDAMISQENFADAIDILYEIRSTVNLPNELSCINSLITIFENVDSVDVINRNALNIYIRELTGLSHKQMSIAMNAIRQRFRTLRATERD